MSLLLALALQALVNQQPAPPPELTAAQTTAQQAMTKAQAAQDAAQAAQAAIPVPADVVPPAEMIGGSVGATNTFRRGDSAQPRITRMGTVPTASDGSWAITFATPLSAVPGVLPIAINPTATQAIVCNTTTRTMSGATGKCWQAMAPAIISLTVATNPLPAVGAGISVQVFAIPPTQ